MDYPKPHIGHFVLFTSFVANAANSGMCYANTAYYYGHWLEEFGENSWLTSMVGSVNIGALSLVGPLAGAMIDRCGYRFTALFGSFLSSIGLLVSAFSPNIYVLLVFYFLTGVGWGFSYIPLCLAFTHFYEPKYQGICIGIIMCGVGLGHFITPPIADVLTQEYTWRGAMIIQSGLSAQSFLLGASLRPTDSMKRMKSGTSWKLSLFKNTDFLCLLAHMFLFTTGLSVVFIHFAYCVERYTKVDSKQSAMVVSAMGLASLCSKLIHGLLCKLKYVNPVLEVMVSVMMAGVSTILIPFSPSLWVTVTIAVVIGFSIGPYGPVIVVIILNTLRNEDAPLAFGYANLMGGIGLYIGAPVAGALYDKTSNYLASMIFGGVIFICSGLVFWKPALAWQIRIKRRQTRGESKRIDVREIEEPCLLQAPHS